MLVTKGGKPARWFSSHFFKTCSSGVLCCICIWCHQWTFRLTCMCVGVITCIYCTCIYQLCASSNLHVYIHVHAPILVCFFLTSMNCTLSVCMHCRVCFVLVVPHTIYYMHMYHHLLLLIPFPCLPLALLRECGWVAEPEHNLKGAMCCSSPFSIECLLPCTSMCTYVYLFCIRDIKVVQSAIRPWFGSCPARERDH